jgi:hypothetical protein
MSGSFAYLSKTEETPVIFANPRANCRMERKDITQERWRRKIALYRLQPANEISKLVLLAASAAINGVDDSRQINI